MPPHAPGSRSICRSPCQSGLANGRLLTSFRMEGESSKPATTPTGAVFLSYASQDAAAKRVCESLRSAGIEVCLDQTELRGGDARDAAIRLRIKACAQFIPIISLDTQAGAEGYFRPE